MDYFNHVAVSFMSAERGKKMVKRVKQPVGRLRMRPLEPSGAG